MLSASDWREIQSLVNRIVTQKGEPFIQGKVIKVDQARKVIFMKEFGDTPIPIIAFDYQVRYQYVNATDQTIVKYTTAYSEDVKILLPRVGDTVLVAQHFGTNRLPKCLGVVKSKRYVETSGE